MQREEECRINHKKGQMPEFTERGKVGEAGQ